MTIYEPTGRVLVKKTAKGNVWYVVINLKRDKDGKYPQKFINTHLQERGNKKKAEEILERELENYKAELNQGEDLKTESVNQGANDLLFIDYLREYVMKKKYEIKPLVFDTYNRYVNEIEQYFNDKGEQPLLKEIKAKDFNDFYFHLREKGLKVLTLKHYECVLRPTMRQAFIDDLIPNNPYEKVKTLKIPKEEQPTELYLTGEEMKEFIKKVWEERNKPADKRKLKVGPFLIVDLLLGLRRSELMGLKWSNIDFDNHKIFIDGTIQKRKTEILISESNKTVESKDYAIMSSMVEEVLLTIKHEQEENKKLWGNGYNTKYEDYVCVNPLGVIYNPDFMTKQLKAFVRANNMKDIHLHSLRHSFCSFLYDETKDIEAVRKAMRHKDIRTTLRYIHQKDEENKQKMANILSNAFNSIQDDTKKKDEKKNNSCKNKKTFSINS